jgi:hypothetical protein
MFYRYRAAKKILFILFISPNEFLEKAMNHP